MELKYYFYIENGKINGKGQCKDDTAVEVTQEVYNNLEQYLWNGSEIILDPDYDAKKLAQAKTEKYNEALKKAYEFEQNGTVEYKNCIFEMSTSNRNNLRDTVEALSALGQTETTWNDKNDELITLSIEDIQYIRLNLILGAIQKLWITDYPQYKQAIEEAESVEEVDAIEIDYAAGE